MSRFLITTRFEQTKSLKDSFDCSAKWSLNLQTEFKLPDVNPHQVPFLTMHGKDIFDRVLPGLPGTPDDCSLITLGPKIIPDGVSFYKNHQLDQARVDCLYFQFFNLEFSSLEISAYLSLAFADNRQYAMFMFRGYALSLTVVFSRSSFVYSDSQFIPSMDNCNLPSSTFVLHNGTLKNLHFNAQAPLVSPDSYEVQSSDTYCCGRLGRWLDISHGNLHFSLFQPLEHDSYTDHFEFVSIYVGILVGMNYTINYITEDDMKKLSIVPNVDLTAMEACHISDGWSCEVIHAYRLFSKWSNNSVPYEKFSSYSEYVSAYTNTPFISLSDRTKQHCRLPCSSCPASGSRQMASSYPGNNGKQRLIRNFQYGIRYCSFDLSTLSSSFDISVTRPSYGISFIKHMGSKNLLESLNLLRSIPGICSCSWGASCGTCVVALKGIDFMIAHSKGPYVEHLCGVPYQSYFFGGLKYLFHHVDNGYDFGSSSFTEVKEKRDIAVEAYSLVSDASAFVGNIYNLDPTSVNKLVNSIVWDFGVQSYDSTDYSNFISALRGLVRAPFDYSVVFPEFTTRLGSAYCGYRVGMHHSNSDYG